MDSINEPISSGNIVAVQDVEEPSSQLIESVPPMTMPTNTETLNNTHATNFNNEANVKIESSKNANNSIVANTNGNTSIDAFNTTFVSPGLQESVTVMPSFDATTKAATGFHKREQKTAEDFDIFHNDRDDFHSCGDDDDYDNDHNDHNHHHVASHFHPNMKSMHLHNDNNELNGTNSYDCDNISVDSYGLPTYHQRYDGSYGDGSSDLSVPWNLRRATKKHRFSFFDFMLSPQFWFQFEFALRVTACAVLVPSIILALDVHGNPFISKFMVFSASVLAAKTSVGDSFAYVFTFIRAGCIWLPLSVIGGALNLGNHIIAWCFYYTIIIFFMAVFTESTCHRICLLLFNTSMVGLLTNQSRRHEYGCRVMVDWCIGTGLCVIATFIPYPLLCKRQAQRLLARIGKNTATAFCGLVYSFWSPTNVERNMAMSKVRLMIDSLDTLMPEFESREAFTLYEFLFESSEVRELREMKYHFFEKIRVNMSSMNRVLDMVETTPDAIDKSDRSRAFGELLIPHLNSVGEAFDELMEELSMANTKKKILELEKYFGTLHWRTRQMQKAYLNARRMLFYEYTSSTLEEFVPLMTFYIFTIVCFDDTVYEYQRNVENYEPSHLRTIHVLWMKVFGDPFLESIEFVQKLFRLRNRREVQRVIEAVKICGAMILTIGFTYLINVDKASFTGPNIIAFITGSNPVEAVQASIVRLTGCVIGTVLGFFASTYSTTAVQRVASLCTLMFAGTFLRNDKEYGIMSIYGMFVLIPLDTVMKATINDTVERMNQNTFGIFFYIVISAAIFPLSPSTILRNKRKNVLKRMNDAISRFTELFEAPLPHTSFGGRTAHREEPYEFDPYDLVKRDYASGEYEMNNVDNDITTNNNNHNKKVNKGKSNVNALTINSSTSNSNSNNASMPINEVNGTTAANTAHTNGNNTNATHRSVTPLTPSQGVRNRSIIILPGRDAAMDELDGVLHDVTRRLKATRAYVEFAKNERTLLEKDYPVKACAATYYHMYRMNILLRTMWLSWNVLRGQSKYTIQTQHMLHSLYPIAVDISHAFARFVHLLTYMMDDPSINLEGEIMKSVLDLIAACKELHLRKSQIMLMLINTSVEHYRDKASGLGTRINSTDGLNVLPEVEALNNARLHASQNHHTLPSNQLALEHHHHHHHNHHNNTSQPPFHTFCNSSNTSNVHRNTKHASKSIEKPLDLICHSAQPAHTDESIHTHSAHSRLHEMQLLPSHPHANISRAATIDPSSLRMLYHISGSASPTRHMFRVASNDRNVTVLPFLRHQSGTADTDTCSVEPVRLPDKFTFPVSSEDAEGLHSFTLCLDMFANETKMLMMSISAMNDFRRTKM